MTTTYLPTFQSPRAITRSKIIGQERNANLVCNFSVFTDIPKIKCIREQIECVDAYELFKKQGNVLKSLFDNTDSSGVHISVERTNSALSSTPNSIERQNKQTRIVSPPV